MRGGDLAKNAERYGGGGSTALHVDSTARQTKLQTRRAGFNKDRPVNPENIQTVVGL